MSVDLVNKLAEQGIVSLLLAISIGANVYLTKGWLAEKDKRVKDAQVVMDKVTEPLSNLRKSVDNMYSLLQIIAKN